jgi:hypothetical protein
MIRIDSRQSVLLIIVLDPRQRLKFSAHPAFSNKQRPFSGSFILLKDDTLNYPLKKGITNKAFQ